MNAELRKRAQALLDESVWMHGWDKAEFLQKIAAHKLCVEDAMKEIQSFVDSNTGAEVMGCLHALNTIGYHLDRLNEEEKT